MYKYLLGQQISKGSFGNIYLIKKKETNTIYVVKEIERDDQYDYLNEEKILKDVQDNHLFNKYIETYLTNSNIYFILEYETGGNLLDIINNIFRGKLSEDFAKFYGLEIALGLEYLHSKQIIYRDLKLENILISKEGHIKLCDFGLSTYGKKHTYNCGTLLYMAPEMLLYNEIYTNSIDIWSLGIVLYEMIYGYNPFYGNNPKEDIKYLLQNIRLLKYNLKYISKKFNTLIKKLLSFKKKRPSIKKVLKYKWFKTLKKKYIRNRNCPQIIPYIPLRGKQFELNEELNEELIETQNNLILFDKKYKLLDTAVLILTTDTYNCIYYNNKAKQLLNITDTFSLKNAMKSKFILFESIIDKNSMTDYNFTEYLQLDSDLDIYMKCSINISKEKINNSNYLVTTIHKVNQPEICNIDGY